VAADRPANPATTGGALEIVTPTERLVGMYDAGVVATAPNDYAS
jgi:hypothetical protein